MGWTVLIVLGVLSIFFGFRLPLLILSAGLIGWLLCDIDPLESYGWLSGIWHGIFFVPNYIRHLVWDAEFKATDYTVAYNVFYWITSILSTLGFLFGGIGGRRD